MPPGIGTSRHSSQRQHGSFVVFTSCGPDRLGPLRHRRQHSQFSRNVVTANDCKDLGANTSIRCLDFRIYHQKRPCRPDELLSARSAITRDSRGELACQQKKRRGTDRGSWALSIGQSPACRTRLLRFCCKRSVRKNASYLTYLV